MPATHQEHMRHHRGCKGKAHASGIGKALNGKNGPNSPTTKIIKIAASPQKQTKAKNNNNKDQRKMVSSLADSPRRASDQLTNVRKLSRNSTSSWEYSDSDSLNSSEPGLSSMDHHGNGMHDQMIRRIDRVLDDIDNAKSIYDDKLVNGNHNNKSRSSPLVRGTNYTSSLRRTPKKEVWADTLRSGLMVDDKIKKMEEGWDDSIIRVPRERKCHRITADIEQRDPRDLEQLNRRNSISRRNSAVGKVVKRSRGGSQAPLYDVIEWEELLEMALTTRNGKRRRESDHRNGMDGCYLKDLEVLRNNVAPTNLEVLYWTRWSTLLTYVNTDPWQFIKKRII